MGGEHGDGGGAAEARIEALSVLVKSTLTTLVMRGLDRKAGLPDFQHYIFGTRASPRSDASIFS